MKYDCVFNGQGHHTTCSDPSPGLPLTFREAMNCFTFHVILLYCFVSVS